MTLAEWLAAGAEPATLTPEEVRRQQNLLAVREEQAAARLSAMLDEMANLFRKGADTPSLVLRRVLARRHRRLSAQTEDLERELSRIGKELAGLESIQNLLRDGIALAAPEDCTQLLHLLDDTDSGEHEFADALARSLRSGKVDEPSAPSGETTSEVIDVWAQIDRGELSGIEEGLRRLRRE